MRSTLPEALPRSIQGAINLLRVGIIHARASQLDAKPEDIIQQSYANRHFDEPSRTFAKRLARQQGKVIDDYFSDSGATSVVTLARLGLSLSTVAALRQYVEKLEDWQIENFSKLMFGPEVNINQAVYVIGPVSSRMAELEGPVLGGFYSDVVLQWLAGAPLCTIKSSEKKIEDLIKLIYSRVQYLLPWGLYAVNELTEHEALRRGISYNGEIRKLSYLTDAGVPSFDALRLTALGFERVDATRLAKEFKRRGGLRLGVDVVTWLKGMDRAPLVACVRGEEGRRLDHDFDRLLAGLDTEDD